MYIEGLVLGVIFVSPCVLLYGLFIKGIDRFEPEPIWLLLVMFFWGAVVSTTVAIIASLVGERTMTVFAGVNAADPLFNALSATFIAPFTEESAKGVGLLLLWGASVLFLKELDGPLDGAIYGGVVGLGFTLTEDILYVAAAMEDGGTQQFALLFAFRTILAGLGHASFTALIGLGIGVAVESRSVLVKLAAPFFGWLGAVGLHAVHNALVTFFLGQGEGFVLKILLFWLIDGLYFVLLVGLVLRDRAIILRELRDEVGKLLGPSELKATVSYWILVPFWNYFALSGSPGGYLQARAKQLALIELAFLKQRLTRGESGLQKHAQRRIAAIRRANDQGVWVGRPER